MYSRSGITGGKHVQQKWNRKRKSEGKYLSCAEYVRTFALTSSNSTNPGHFKDSDWKRGKPASGSALLMYLGTEMNEYVSNIVTYDVHGETKKYECAGTECTHSILVDLHFRELKFSEA